jgi:hypothetical protein
MCRWKKTDEKKQMKKTVLLDMVVTVLSGRAWNQVASLRIAGARCSGKVSTAGLSRF